MKPLASGLLGVLLFYALPGFAFLGAVFLLIMAGPDTLMIITDDPTVLEVAGFLHWVFIGMMTLGGMVVAWTIGRRINS